MSIVLYSFEFVLVYENSRDVNLDRQKIGEDKVVSLYCTKISMRYECWYLNEFEFTEQRTLSARTLFSFICVVCKDIDTLNAGEVAKW